MTKRKREELINELARKWQEGTITEEEKNFFNKWYNSFDDTTLEELSSETPVELRDRLYQAIITREQISTGKFRRLNFLYLSAAAAIILLFLSFGLYFYNQDDPSGGKDLEQKAKVHDVSPGGNKAVLTLADGSSIILDSAKNGVLANQGNIAIRKNKDGQLIYQVKGSKKADVVKVAYNTISTPRGGQYQIDLPDGTKVWLNAASTLKFPAVFDAGERRVELNGEAYFEVNPIKSASEKQARLPFIVVSKGQEVKVLGTRFNINAYNDESSVKTTLLEGAVKVVQSATNQSQLLRPGQQSRINGAIQVLNVDAEQEVAWKRGYFIFDNEDVQSIMRKISRWYDLDVEYKANIGHKKFAGTISKFENVSEVLRIMELTGTIRFKIEERRIIVMP